MDPFLYVQEEYDNVERALTESLRYDYGPGQTVDYYKECRFRLEGIRRELEQLRAKPSGSTNTIVAQLWDLANRLTLIERSHLGEFSWPFADAIRKISLSLLSEGDGLKDKVEPIIHMIAEGTSYKISSEDVLDANKNQRLYTVAFPRQLKHHVLMHALFGHELGHATFYSGRVPATLFGNGEPPIRKIIAILRREGPLKDAAATSAWLKSDDAPQAIKNRYKDSRAIISENNLQHWHVELVCDLFGLAIFGPAFAAAHRTYLEPSCRSQYEVEIEKISHPAYAIRREVLIGALRSLNWLSPVITEKGSPIHKAEKALIDYIAPSDTDPWTRVFSDAQLSEVFDVIRAHFHETQTPFATRPENVTLVALMARLNAHLPPIHEEIDKDGVSSTHSVRLEEQLYAGWTYWHGREADSTDNLSFFELNQLCDLALLQQQAIDLQAGRRTL